MSHVNINKDLSNEHAKRTEIIERDNRERNRRRDWGPVYFLLSSFLRPLAFGLFENSKNSWRRSHNLICRMLYVVLLFASFFSMCLISRWARLVDLLLFHGFHGFHRAALFLGIAEGHGQSHFADGETGNHGNHPPRKCRLKDLGYGHWEWTRENIMFQENGKERFYEKVIPEMTPRSEPKWSDDV